jgi:hypothetical protein
MGISAADLQHYLKDINYPVNKGDLIKHAKQHGANDEVVTLLSKFPEQQYNVPTDVSRALGKIK